MVGEPIQVTNDEHVLKTGMDANGIPVHEPHERFIGALAGFGNAAKVGGRPPRNRLTSDKGIDAGAEPSAHRFPHTTKIDAGVHCGQGKERERAHTYSHGQVAHAHERSAHLCCHGTERRIHAGGLTHEQPAGARVNQGLQLIDAASPVENRQRGYTRAFEYGIHALRNRTLHQLRHFPEPSGKGLRSFGQRFHGNSPSEARLRTAP